jgi:hypothetical protein
VPAMSFSNGRNTLAPGEERPALQLLPSYRRGRTVVRYKISGAIGIIWGGLILFNGLTSDETEAVSSAYKSGQTASLVFGAALVAVGVYYFFKKPKPKA